MAVKINAMLARRSSTSGVQVTAESIGWLLAALFFIALILLFVVGPGKTWVNGNLNSVTSTDSTTLP